MTDVSGFVRRLIVGNNPLSPVPLLARTTDSQSSWFRTYDLDTLVFTLLATAKAGQNPTLDVTVETASDNIGTDLVEIGTFTLLTNTGSERKIFTGLDRYSRVKWLMDDDGTDPAVAATAVLTSDNTEVVDGDTVTVNNVTYRFKDTMAQANDVKRSGVVDTTLANLVAAVNQSGTPGTEYFAGTVAPTDVTAGAVAAHAITFTATTAGLGGNAYPKAETSAHLDFDGVGAFFTGGLAALSWTFSVLGYGK
jgi:hypothetical protein